MVKIILDVLWAKAKELVEDTSLYQKPQRSQKQVKIWVETGHNINR